MPEPLFHIQWSVVLALWALGKFGPASSTDLSNAIICVCVLGRLVGFFSSIYHWACYVSSSFASR